MYLEASIWKSQGKKLANFWKEMLLKKNPNQTKHTGKDNITTSF